MEPLDYLKKIEKFGFEAYIVGGFVRNKILNIPTTDIDITTSATPKDIKKIFGVTNSDNMGSVNIKTSDLNIDITTYRKDSNYIKHTPKTVEYIKDLEADLLRRDFKINAICMDSLGKIIDPLNGLEDLRNKRINVIGEVKSKFSEDPLRMLRALRLSIVYDFEIGEEEIIYITNNKKEFEKVSFYRKKSELGKILVSKNCIQGLKFLNTLGLLEMLEITVPDTIVYCPDYIGMWAQIDFSDNYLFTRLEKTRIKNIRNILKYGKIDALTIFKYGFYDAAVAAEILNFDSELVNKIYNDMVIKSESELKISGNDIMDLLHIGESRKVKEIKDDVIMNLLLNRIENETDILREYILKKWK